MKSPIGRGIVGGLLASILMALLAYAGSVLGLVQRDLPEMLGRMYLPPTVPSSQLMLASLATHCVIAVAWAILFAVIFPSGGIRNGIAYAMVPWAILIAIMFVASKVGLVSVQVTWGVAAITLVLHVVYGSLLGWWLKHPSPATEVSPAH